MITTSSHVYNYVGNLQAMLSAEKAVLALIVSLPDQKLEGKKRLQKMCHLLAGAGLAVNARFSLHHFGAFSREIEEAAEILSIRGMIDAKEERTDEFPVYQTTYSIRKHSDYALPNDKKALANRLNVFRTVELEIASTILLFFQRGSSASHALKETCLVKPLKCKPSVIREARKILKQVKPELADAL